MHYALIENGVVTNVIIWDGELQDWSPPEGVTAVGLTGEVHVAIGYTYDGTAFAAPPAPETVPVVPTSVTMRQARLALLAVGKLQAVTDAIAALPSPQKDAAQIEWEFAATVDRDSPFLQSLAGALGLDEEALDALFTAAAVL